MTRVCRRHTIILKEKNMRNDDVYLQLYLIRHAESLGNIETDEVFDGVNPPLSPHGEEQVKALSGRFSEKKPDHLYSSPLLRARQTAQALDMDIIILSELAEKDISVDISGFSPVSESDEACAERAEKVIKMLREKHRGESVALVSHGEFIQFLIRAALEIKNVKFCVYNASVTKINFRENGKENKLALQNDISHLSETDGDRLFWL